MISSKKVHYPHYQATRYSLVYRHLSTITPCIDPITPRVSFQYHSLYRSYNVPYISLLVSIL